MFFGACWSAHFATEHPHNLSDQMICMNSVVTCCVVSHSAPAAAAATAQISCETSDAPHTVLCVLGSLRVLAAPTYFVMCLVLAWFAKADFNSPIGGVQISAVIFGEMWLWACACLCRCCRTHTHTHTHTHTQPHRHTHTATHTQPHAQIYIYIYIMCIYEYYYVYIYIYIYILCGTTTELDVCLVRTKPNNFMTHNKSLRVAPEATWASGTNCGATCCVRMMKCLIVVLMFVSPCQAGADARRLQPRPCVRTG